MKELITEKQFLEIMEECNKFLLVPKPFNKTLMMHVYKEEAYRLTEKEVEVFLKKLWFHVQKTDLPVISDFLAYINVILPAFEALK